MAIYTRTGDTGETSLFGGKRVRKDDGAVQMYGAIDEVNSHIGLVVSVVTDPIEKEFLYNVQSDLLSIGAYLSGSADTLRIHPSIQMFEAHIDKLELRLKELHAFILPGGTTHASFIHIARTVVRRVERLFVSYKRDVHDDEAILVYLNRLSDYLFCLARFTNQEEHGSETVWK